MKKFFALAGLLFSSTLLEAGSLPPLGKRRYLLDNQKPERPARIEGIESPASELGSIAVMKDPIPLGTKPPATDTKGWIPAAPVGLKTSKMKFEKVAVSGRYAVPRVSFEREAKEISHADEPIKQDYRKKMQESEQILKDLNW